MKILKHILILAFILSLIKHNVCIAQNYKEEQQHEIDSLNQIINSKNAADTSLAYAYLGLSELITDGEVDTMIVLCRKTEMIAQRGLKSAVGKEKTSFLISLAGAYNNLGYAFRNKGDITLGLDYFHESLKIYEELNEKEGITNCLINLGTVYDSQKEYEKALSYFSRGLDISTEIDYFIGQGACLNNIGAVYRDMNKLDLALEYYLKSYEIAKQYAPESELALPLNNIGTMYKGNGDLDKALEYYQRSFAILEKNSNKQGMAYLLNNIGGVEYVKNNLSEAIHYSEKSLSISKEIGFPENIKNASVLLSRIYTKQGKYNLALDMFKLYIQMRDSINNEKNQKALIQQQAKYEYEKQKAIDDAEHKKEIAIEQEAKEKQTVLTIATAIGFLLVAVFLLIVFNRLKVTRKQKNIIEEQKQEVENQKTVVELAHTELEEKNKEITDSIQYAKRIQSAILPSNKVVKEYLTESFILYKPKDIVAGDFYWMEQKDNKVLFAAADCTGHGVPGTMVSVVCNNGLNRSVREYGLSDPGEILNKTREIVVSEFEKSEEEVKDGMDIALCSLEGNKLQYAGAHNPLWIIRNGELLETKANKQPIGQFDNPEPYTTHTIELQKGDSLYIFSDGYVDQFGGDKGKKLKTVNFKKLLLSIQKENMQKQKQLIDETFENWKGNLEQLDDVCVIGVRI